ncbi:MAG TPA: 50S ribosomal protein L24 [Spirochaetota bacterium]|nr:50S ribosomal protein L24 [Spirochaetota bacterium]HPQ51787.1 50S ribosomal protein L24 [Spirochaetota bacterium]
MNKSIIKKNDNVVVISGKDRGSRGKVLFVDTKRGRVVIEGVNKKKKFLRPSNENPKGGVISIEYPINISNVMVFCEKCKKAVRLGIEISGDKKVRVCKKCNKTLD